MSLYQVIVNRLCEEEHRLSLECEKRDCPNGFLRFKRKNTKYKSKDGTVHIYVSQYPYWVHNGTQEYLSKEKYEKMEPLLLLKERLELSRRLLKAIAEAMDLNVESIKEQYLRKIHALRIKPKRKFNHSANAVITQSGEVVRSKSKCILSLILALCAIPNETEPRVKIPFGGYREFRIPDKEMTGFDDQPVYIELVGMMDKKEYRQSYQEKIEDYALAGICHGRNLIEFRTRSNVGINAQRMLEVIQLFAEKGIVPEEIVFI